METNPISDMETKRKSDALWDLCNNLYENESQNIADKWKNCYSYWNGDFKSDNAKLSDQKKTACNIVKRVVEVKTAASLGAKFTSQVVPVMNAFADSQRIQDMHDYADILQSEVHNVEKENHVDVIDEIIMRRGNIAGMAPSQVVWDTTARAEGEIKITPIEVDNFRWDKNAKKIEDCTFHAYTIELNPSLVKKRYAKDNEYLCKKIDEITETKTNRQKSQPKGVVNVSTSDGASQAYVYDTSGISSGKVVKMVVMFLLDDSVYQPESGDGGETEAVKQESSVMYPNGRMIVFSADASHKIIFDDKPAPEAFKCLGNVDIFVPLNLGEVVGKGDVEDLIPIQDRINGVYNRLRILIGEHISTFLFPNDLKGIVKEGALVQNPVTFVESLNLLGPDRTPPYITNNNIEQSDKLLTLIERYEQEAYRTARINETLLSGEQVSGVTSAAQVEALAESPMESIRSIQRNFKDYVVGRTCKIINFIQNNYTVQRLVKLATGINGAEYAKFGQGKVELLDRAGKIVREINVDPQWQFKVEVTAGTEIPRSRREMASLADKIAVSPVMQSGDTDMIDMYLTSQDFPQRRALVQSIKKKQEAASTKKYTMQDVLMSPPLAKSLSEMIDSLAKAGMTSDISSMLQFLGLTGMADTLETAPIQSVTSKSDVKDIVASTAGKVSHEQPNDIHGREIVGEIIDKQLYKNHKVI